MTYDERDPRDQSPPETDEGAPQPSEPTDAPPHDVVPDEDRGAEAEFETATWPAQDTEASAESHQEPEPMSAEAEPMASDPMASAPPEPPPSDAEAYQAASEPTEPAMPAHSVPATEPGESTRCARCGTENRPGIAFCRNCGQRLVAAGAPTTVERPAAPEGTQACPRCGTHNRAGVAFCQNCGANLRSSATEAGYVPPAAPAAPPADVEAAPARAVLGPIVLLIGAIGMTVAWLLPFPLGAGSLYDRAFGTVDGYGVAFWNAYDGITGLASQAYFGFAAPVPILVVLLVLLAIAGMLRPAPGVLQWLGLIVAIVWAIGLGTLFVVVEIFGGEGGSLIDVLRGLTAGGIIFLLASLIVLIGSLTRFGRA